MPVDLFLFSDSATHHLYLCTLEMQSSFYGPIGKSVLNMSIHSVSLVLVYACRFLTSRLAFVCDAATARMMRIESLLLL